MALTKVPQPLAEVSIPSLLQLLHRSVDGQLSHSGHLLLGRLGFVSVLECLGAGAPE